MEYYFGIIVANYMIQKVVTLPYSGLRKRSKPIGHISQQTRQLITDMEDSTLDWEDKREHEVGVALAAVQIDSKKRVVVIRNNFDNKQDRSFTAYINPEIEKYEGDIVTEFEGCLSVKDLYGKVPRYSKVRVKAKDIDGNVVRLTAEGFLARVFQHEIDHTNGILFVDKIKDNPEAFHRLRKVSGKIESLTDGERDEAFATIFKEEADS